MSEEKKILYRIEQPVVAEGEKRLPSADFMFWCQGCQSGHGVWTTKKNTIGASWTFNNDMDKPTFTPSILTQYNRNGKPFCCHLYVKNGQIQFLGDCTHEFAGKTVDMEKF